MQLIEGYHVTATERKAIQAILLVSGLKNQDGQTAGRVGRTDYQITRTGQVLDVTIRKAESDWTGPKMRTHSIKLKLTN